MMWTRRAFAAGGAAAMAAPATALAQGDRFAAAKAYSAGARGVSFLLLDDQGAILAEDYPNGGRVDAGWELASGTKSFSGVALAAAVQDGLMRLDQPCADHLPEWRGDDRRAITIRQLLSLTSGIAGGRLGRPPAYAEAITLPAGASPGSRFAYGPAPFQIFGEILRRASGQTPLDYLQKRLFDPLGIAPKRWTRGADGHIHMPSGAAFTARDWGQFGVMTLNGWRRQGAPLVDGAALVANFNGTRANPGYGLTWWLLRPGLMGPSPRSGVNAQSIGAEAMAEDIVMAAGAGNQRLYLLRKRRLVLVRQADRIGLAMIGRGPDWSDAEFLRRVLTSVGSP